MHIQARATIKGSAFVDDEPGSDGGDGEEVTASAHYQAGALSELLGHLDGAGFNLRAASGHDIELGGEFSFWCDERRDEDGKKIDKDHEEATNRAADVLREQGYTVDIFEVHRRKLNDSGGTLKALVDSVTAAGYLVREISVGTVDPDDGKIPVQIFTVKVG
jgi:hypothetical protein